MSALPMAAMAVPQTAEERRREAQRLKVLQDWRVFHVNILRKAYTATLEQVWLRGYIVIVNQLNWLSTVVKGRNTNRLCDIPGCRSRFGSF